MKSKLKKYTPDIIFLLTVVSVIALLVWQIPVDDLKQLVSENMAWSGVIFIFLMIISTVVPPIVVFPIIPFVALLLGPFITTIYSVVGWTIGSMISLLIARHCGLPFLSRFISLDKLKRYKDKISGKSEFWVLVFLRMIIPVDILSYAVGIFSRVGFWKYSLASFLGVIPFSFAFSYGYDIFFLKSKSAIALVVSFIVLILTAFYLYKDKK
ncbi:MAG: VTT domain-containing protein [Patescibacteria group bacterium]|nr:VTT domain-containing protein [Patescibacteria group bacterium]